MKIQGDTLWLVTAIPSRKTKREYRKEKLNIEEKEIEALYGSNALELHKPDKGLLRQLKAAAEAGEIEVADDPLR